MANIEIETSSDSVEQVKEALGSTVEIEDTTAEPEEKKEPTPKEEKPAPKEGEDDSEVDTNDEEKPTEDEEQEEHDDKEKDKEKGKEKPAAKPAPNLVPRSRLNEEIRKRKEAERERDEAKKPRVADTEEKATTDGPPESFTGLPEPKIEDFAGNDKYPDPYAAFTKAHGDWVRKETLAEVEYNKVLEAAEKERLALVENFNKNVKETIKRHPDYSDIVTDSPVQISGFMERRIHKSTIGGDILLYLASNPERSEEIAKMDLDDQAVEMVALERKIKGQIAKATKEEPEEEASTEEEEEPVAEPKGRVIPKKEVPPKKTPPPPPAARIKAAGPAPKSLEELAGPTDRTGIDIDFNPDYEKAVKAGQRR